MTPRSTRRNQIIAACVLLAALLAACSQPAAPVAAPTSTPIPPTATLLPPTSTPVPPTATPVPPTNTIGPTKTPVPPTATPTPESFPPRRWLYPAAYDAESGKAIYMAGYSARGAGTYPNQRDMWALDVAAGTWEYLGECAPRGVPFAAYDAGSDRIIVYDYDAAAAWAYDYNQRTWQKMKMPRPAPDTHPFGMALAYDAESDRVILFGGANATFTTNATWAYDYDTDTWTKMAPSVSPPPRAQAAMVYDPAADRVIMWSGSFPSGDADATVWAYDYNADAWEAVETQGGPPALWGASMAYDASTGRAIMFGGTLVRPADTKPEDYYEETWAFDYKAATWTKLSPASHPPARRTHRLVYDSRANLVVLFGGELAEWGAYERDVWAFDGQTNEWRLAMPGP